MKTLRKNIHFLVIGIGVILIWRGVWGLADVLLFPKNQLISFSVSIVMGIIILVIKHEKLNDLF